MELNRQSWNKKDIQEFYEYQKELIGEVKDCEWEQKIVNTKLKCYGKTSFKAKLCAKEIKKGAYLEFLNNVKINTHFDSLVCAFLICGIKDFTEFEKQLDKYVLTIDNWASCDTLKFKRKEYENLCNLSQKYLNSEQCFVRRVGLNIFFDLIKVDKNLYIEKAFNIIDKLNDEKEYYVNMCAAWLLSCCFVENRELTLNYFKNNKTNGFIINKAISKCRDSFRVSKEDKELLLNYKR